MAGLTVDAGALIAIDRGDVRAFEYLAVARRRRVPIVVPAPVVAQAWRSARNARMAQFLALAFVEDLTYPLATKIGLLLAASATSDVVDGAVIVGAAARGDDVLTSDPEDLSRLAAAAPRAGLSRPGRILSIEALPGRR
ncbi:MAG: hypothetical protein HS107_01995 [Thermoflexaceae bacterium]|nr:hypothetical protein [Thermoflexaceae bacterium]